MNIIDAIKSGKKFRRKGQEYWKSSFTETEMLYKYYSAADVLADDWEVEEKTVTITKSQLESACHNAAGNTHLSVGPIEFVSFIIELQKELGL